MPPSQCSGQWPLPTGRAPPALRRPEPFVAREPSERSRHKPPLVRAILQRMEIESAWPATTSRRIQTSRPRRAGNADRGWRNRPPHRTNLHFWRCQKPAHLSNPPDGEPAACFWPTSRLAPIEGSLDSVDPQSPQPTPASAARSQQLSGPKDKILASRCIGYEIRRDVAKGYGELVRLRARARDAGAGRPNYLSGDVLRSKLESPQGSRTVRSGACHSRAYWSDSLARLCPQMNCSAARSCKAEL